jgi:hypothetical protein
MDLDVAHTGTAAALDTADSTYSVEDWSPVVHRLGVHAGRAAVIEPMLESWTVVCDIAVVETASSWLQLPCLGPASLCT